MPLTIKPKSECTFDQISLGEVMLRLDPGEGRIRTARHFTVWEGGGEYNTSRGLRKCFGYKTAVKAFPNFKVASTTPGDTSMVTRKEVEKVIGGGARVVR